VGDHPVKVPEELAGQLWFESADKPSQCNTFRAHVFAQKIAEWAADQELEACEVWVQEHVEWCIPGELPADELRAARRPKPPTLAEQGMEALRSTPCTEQRHYDALFAALNRLAELEADQ
jgi:hypothetical protein